MQNESMPACSICKPNYDDAFIVSSAEKAFDFAVNSSMIRESITFIKLLLGLNPALKAIPAMADNGKQIFLKRKKAAFDPRITPGIRF